MRIVRLTVMVAAAALALVLLLIGLLSVTRGTPVKQVIADTTRSRAQLPIRLDERALRAT
jgi:hypothetical protein